MSKENLIPELRFPDFVNEGEWLMDIVSNVAEYENGKAHEQDIVEQGKYVVVNSKFISTDGEVRKYTNSANCLAKKNEILMVLSDVPNGRAIAKCFHVDKDEFYTVNQRICKITPIKVNSELLFYLLNRNQYFLAFDDGVKQTNLRNEDVLSCPIILPKNPKEQQRIASCLSSLDEVIAAHSQKLELLKEHKKGLMQNLFPQEGETVPKLRFKEFVKDGEWVEKSLEYLTIKIGDGIHTTPKYDPSGEYYFINGNNLIEGKVFVDEKTKRVSSEEFEIHKKDLTEKTIFLSINGTIGNLAFYNNEMVVLGKSACYITPSQKLNNVFLYYFLQSPRTIDYFFSELTGSTIKNLSLKSIRDTLINLPSEKEQQKIATCLSSLDALITAQAEKIEQLKLHKRGLMQGLFPQIKDLEV